MVHYGVPMDNKIEFPNIGEEEIDLFFGDTVSEETHGEWYYENITHFGSTSRDFIRNSQVHHDLDEKGALKNIENTLSQQAREHYTNKMAIYYDLGCGHAMAGLIKDVRLATGHECGVGKNSPDYRQRINAELWFLIDGKEYDCIWGVHMIDHTIPMDDPTERCFEDFGDAVEKLTKLNDRGVR
tara:strand:- start:216 stop:767 length:552 start_codon:yes stop_codon:yes gene_type:complete